MKRRRPPPLANLLLTRFGPLDEALVGDLFQEWSEGRSSVWLWQQTIGAILWGAVGDVRRRPGRMCAALLTGWAIVGALFLAGDAIADGVARLIWGWQRQQAYLNHHWGPFYAGALLVSYGGFGASAWLVARVHRQYPAMLLAYVAVTFALLLTTGIVMDVLIRQGTPIPIVHPLFYAVSVTLPFQWHSGIVLVPLTMLFSGAIALRSSA